MTRKIAFRAWDKVTKDMSNGFELDHRGLVGFSKSTGYVLEEIRCQPGRFELMQFTGLLDKNGKEIYEGDIVCHVEDIIVENIGGYDRTEPEGRFLKVGWNSEFLSWYLWDEKGGGESMDREEEYEVIGNIYENPSILTNSEDK